MTTPLQPQAIRVPLTTCGYRPDLLRSEFRFGEGQIAPLVGFAQTPTDSRSACVAITSATVDPRSAVDACRALAAPVVFVCVEDALQWWKQGAQSPQFLENIPRANIEQFFRHHKEELSPDVVYRAKTWGRFKTEYQLSFVDLGLMPLVEKEVGRSLEGLIERNVSELKGRLGLDAVTEAKGHWLLQTIFWLVSGKILHDKHVGPFADLDLNDVEEVFSRLATHYGVSALQIRTARERSSLREAAQVISRFSSLALTTTESLAYVYENALISKETRTKLGTHSTPSFLVDYVVGNLTDWIKELHVDQRSVFEPACGHAAFLVSAMRLLTELLPPDRATAQKRGPYLRRRLHGSDIDPFALELARLSLTLTDIPNPDGWDLVAEDMFIGDRLIERAKKSTILLANPPFDNFTPREQMHYRNKNADLRFVNKSAEMLWRTLPHLSVGAVFGVILPQSFLHNNNAKDARRVILSDFELQEICLFPDRVFSFSDAESVILLGRRKQPIRESSVRYRRVRERELSSFRSGYVTSSTAYVSQSRFSEEQTQSLRVPDLENIWIHLADNPTLADVASAGQGFIFHGADLPPQRTTHSKTPFTGGRKGFVHFEHGLSLHELPEARWVSLDPAVIRRAVSGTTVGSPQVLLNYAPSSRGPWRLKALLDRKGHPVSSRFIAVRPTTAPYSIEALWALLNSPISNAYVYSHLGKRDNVVGDIRKMPMPVSTSFAGIERAANKYLEAASSGTDASNLQGLLLDIDCETLRLYSLPTELERPLLDVFTGWERLGVPFTQDRYFPNDFHAQVSFSDFRKLDESWPRTNRERGGLIDKGISGQLDKGEQARLDLLQDYADYHLNAVAPRPIKELEALEERLFSDQAQRGNKS